MYLICDNFRNARILGLIELLLSELSTKVRPMQYLLNPVGLSRISLMALSKGDWVFRPPLLSSIITKSFTEAVSSSVPNFRSISIVQRSLKFLLTRVIRVNRFFNPGLSTSGSKGIWFSRKAISAAFKFSNKACVAIRYLMVLPLLFLNLTSKKCMLLAK